MHDSQIIEGEAIKYYDFEFEQYTITKEILRELLLDEIILANSKEARQLNFDLKEKFPQGVLELIYERYDKADADISTLVADDIKPPNKQAKAKSNKSSTAEMGNDTAQKDTNQAARFEKQVQF